MPAPRRRVEPCWSIGCSGALAGECGGDRLRRIRAHGLQMAGALSSRRRAGLRPQLGGASPTARLGAGLVGADSPAAPGQAGGRRDRGTAADGALHRERGAEPLGLGRLRYLNPPPPVQRYEWSRPGELVHVDIKKLGRIVRPSHRVTGNRRDNVAGGGWEYAMSPSTIARASPMSNPARREALYRHPLSGCARCANSGAAASGSTRADRQRRRLSLAAVPQGLSLARHQHQTHATVSTADQRQSRTHDPNPAAQMGLRRSLRQLGAAACCLPLAASTMRNDPMLAFIDKHRSADWLSSLNNGRRNHS